MRSQPEGWAIKWLEKMRADGSTGLTLEKNGNRHYVYWASSKWDRDAKKRKKLTEYIGILEPPGNLIISSDIDLEKMDPRAVQVAKIDVERYKKRPDTIMDYRIRGTMAILERACRDFFPSLRESFPKICDDLLMLAMARLCGRGRLCQAGRWFVQQDNLMSLNAHVDPEYLSNVLKIAGGCIDAQDKFFESLKTSGKHMAVDMTVCFSKGKAYLIKKGYNRFRLKCGQFNLAVICGLDDKLPQALKTVAGNVKEGCIIDILKEMEIGTDCVLVMDRGYLSEEVMDELHYAGYRFVIPVRRNSQLYEELDLESGKGFRFRGNAVLWGKGKGMGYNAYRFENENQRNSELSGMMWDGESDPDKKYSIDGDPSRAGNLILITDLNEDPQTLYEMFKLRCSVEECNDTSKNVLSADSTYLRDNLSIMGFNFVTFLALRMYMTMEHWIALKDMTSRYSPSDVLYEYGSLVSITTPNRVMDQTIPANILRIEEDLGLGIAGGKFVSKKVVP